MIRILALGTYPTRRPIQGGQRRVSRIAEYYSSEGFQYKYASSYSPINYTHQDITPNDFPHPALDFDYRSVPFTEDLASGLFSGEQKASYAHFRRLADEFQPHVIQLEQPFMWPLARRLSNDVCTHAQIIYSSHNVEAALKRDLLDQAGVSGMAVEATIRYIQDIEEELVAAASLIISVSEHDADHYRSLNSIAPLIVARNGADRDRDLGHTPDGFDTLRSDDFLYFVGSAYGPNIQGFEKLVTSKGLYGYPPERLFVVCGGVAKAVAVSDQFLRAKTAYQDRMLFLPDPSDAELQHIRQKSKGSLLPILSGGGSNLKTAEALAANGWVIATPRAMRSYEEFSSSRNVLIASNHAQFRDAILKVIDAPRFDPTGNEKKKVEKLYWDTLLRSSGLGSAIRQIVGEPFSSAYS